MCFKIKSNIHIKGIQDGNIIIKSIVNVPKHFLFINADIREMVYKLLQNLNHYFSCIINQQKVVPYYYHLRIDLKWVKQGIIIFVGILNSCQVVF